MNLYFFSSYLILVFRLADYLFSSFWILETGLPAQALPKSVLKRLLLDILKNKCSLWDINKKILKLSAVVEALFLQYWLQIFTNIKCVLQDHLHYFHWVE